MSDDNDSGSVWIWGSIQNRPTPVEQLVAGLTCEECGSPRCWNCWPRRLNLNLVST